LIAAQSEDSEYFEDEQDNVPQIRQHTHTTQSHSQVRICEFCGSSNTPTWRRGPGGKGSLCNACGIKWRLRKRTKKGEQSNSPEKKIKPSKAPPTKRKRREKENDEETSDPMITLRKPIVFKEKPTEHTDESKGDSRKNYYCKYCNKTWDFTHFKNSQQFGAHCSNCSRRPRQDGPLPHPLYYQDSAPTNLILILRYLQDELSEFEDETITPPSPTSLPTPTSSSLPTVPQLPPISQLTRAHPLPSAANNPLNTLRLAASEMWSTAAVG